MAIPLCDRATIGFFRARIKSDRNVGSDRFFMGASLLPILLHEVGLGFEHTSHWQIYAPDGRRKYLDAGERLSFLSGAADEERPVEALCVYLIFCGCRISEALALRREHIDRDTSSVVVRTMKRRRLAFRRVPLPQTVIDMLWALAPTDGPGLADSPGDGMAMG